MVNGDPLKLTSKDSEGLHGMDHVVPPDASECITAPGTSLSKESLSNPPRLRMKRILTED